MMVVKMGWDSTFVMSVKDAVALAEIIERAHAWKEAYHEGKTNYHAYPNEQQVTMQLVPDSLFEMAKLAGKPEK
jgi:ribosomal protein S12 methylthiotransferase accessory factor YcaO